MRNLETLAHLSDAEDFLAFFGITPDPGVLARHRVAMLRAWAREVAEIEGRRELPSEEERIALYGAALQRAHDVFASGRVRPLLRLVPGGRSCRGCAGA